MRGKVAGFGLAQRGDCIKLELFLIETLLIAQSRKSQTKYETIIVDAIQCPDSEPRQPLFADFGIGGH